MAKGFGSGSKFLDSRKKRSAVAYITFPILSVVGLFFIYLLLYSLFTHHKVNGLIIVPFFFAFIAIIRITDEVVDRAFRTDTYMRGDSGEEQIYDELLKLSDDYFIYRNIKRAGTEYDVDFVVVGPTGIFAVDAKSHSGLFEFQNGHLLKNGKKMEKDVIWQAKQEALFVHNLLKDQLKTDIFVTPVIVFSSFWARLFFGLKDIRGIFIVQKRWLRKLISELSIFRYPVDRRLIEQELQKFCSK